MSQSSGIPALQGTQEEEQYWDPAATSRSLRWALRKNTGWWPQIAEMHMKGMHLPIHRKALNSLTWDIWFSLIHKNTFDVQTTCPLLAANVYVTWPHPTPTSSEQFSRVTWDDVYPVWSPKNSRQVKHTSQLSGCDCFLSWQTGCCDFRALKSSGTIVFYV